MDTFSSGLLRSSQPFFAAILPQAPLYQNPIAWQGGVGATDFLVTGDGLIYALGRGSLNVYRSDSLLVWQASVPGSSDGSLGMNESGVAYAAFENDLSAVSQQGKVLWSRTSLS